jgi:hypothetical protein
MPAGEKGWDDNKAGKLWIRNLYIFVENLGTGMTETQAESGIQNLRETGGKP